MLACGHRAQRAAAAPCRGAIEPIPGVQGFASMSQPDLEVSVVIPCLNEEHTVGICAAKARRAIDALGTSGEVVVVDNGSTDGSAAVAQAAGARVVPEPRRGYGQAYLSGFAAARGRYLVMGDADDTYDF